MVKCRSVYLPRFFQLCFVFLCNTAIAGEWQPLCIEGSSCGFPYQVSVWGTSSPLPFIDRHAKGPLLTSDGIYFNHSPPQLDQTKRHVFLMSETGIEDFSDRLGLVSNLNATQIPGGRTFSFWPGGALAWYSPSNEIETIEWASPGFFWLTHFDLIGPPLSVNGVLNIGANGFATASFWSSVDDGMTWSRTNSSFRLRLYGDKFNLLENPEKSALWAIESDNQGSLAGLWESDDHGASWTQVDDGSFPFNTVRVVHDPADSNVSYALTSHGLFVSVDRGVSWQRTTLTEAVHGMVFVERLLGLTRALIVGTDTGVWVSVDEASSWVSMGNGLPETAHTVTYGHGQLIATSDVGYFTCNAIDCAGLATPLEVGFTEVQTIQFDGKYGNIFDRVRISWKPVDYATVYRVFRCLDDNVKNCGLPIGFSRETSFVDQKATPGIIHHYRVRACVRNHCGDFSASDANFIRLTAPTDIQASDGTFGDRVRISWKAMEGATVYRVFRCTDTENSSCGWPISFPRVTFFDDTKAVSGTVYHYRVRACTTDTCSKFSETNAGFIN